MADKNNKYPDNITGKYYIDNQCIDCNLCTQSAPNNFARNDNNGYEYVSKQPDGGEEGQQCKDALDSCPVNAIGNDG